MARPTDDFFELFRKKRVFPIKKVVGPKRLRNLLKHVIVYAHLKFGALKIICEGYKIRRLIFENRARSRANKFDRARFLAPKHEKK